MKVLFCHGGPIRKDENGRLFSYGYSDAIMTRYLQFGDELQLLMRVAPLREQERNRMSETTVHLSDVFRVPDFLSPKGMLLHGKKAKKIIYDAVRQADVVIAKLPSHVGYSAVAAAKLYHKPYLVEVVGCAYDALRLHSFVGWLTAGDAKRRMQKSVADAPYVSYVTKSFLQQRYPTTGKSVAVSDVVLQPTDVSVLEKRLESIRNKKEPLVIGTLGAVHVRYKGQQFVIRALSELKKQGITNFRYEIVGGGDQSYLKSQIEKYDVADMVVFKGALPHDKVFEWLDSIDIYAQPSRTEGLPRAMVEAMSRALPAFGAESGEIPQLVEKDFVFGNNSKNIRGICSILRKLQDATLREEQAKRNFEFCKQYYKEVLEQRRNEFYQMMKTECNL